MARDHSKWSARKTANRFGEPVTYKYADGTEVEFTKAIVERPKLMDQGRGSKSRSVAAPIEIWIHVDDLPAAPGDRGDTIKLPKRIGDDPTWIGVSAILEQDAGMWHLALGR